MEEDLDNVQQPEHLPPNAKMRGGRCEMRDARTYSDDIPFRYTKLRWERTQDGRDGLKPVVVRSLNLGGVGDDRPVGGAVDLACSLESARKRGCVVSKSG